MCGESAWARMRLAGEGCHANKRCGVVMQVPINLLCNPSILDMGISWVMFMVDMCTTSGDVFFLKRRGLLSRGIAEFSTIGAVEIPLLTIGEGRIYSTQNEGGGYNTHIN